MSTTILAVIVNLLSVLLPKVGITLPSEQLTETAQTIVAIVTGLWIWYQRTRLTQVPKGESDVNLAGIKK